MTLLVSIAVEKTRSKTLRQLRLKWHLIRYQKKSTHNSSIAHCRWQHRRQKTPRSNKQQLCLLPTKIGSTTHCNFRVVFSVVCLTVAVYLLPLQYAGCSGGVVIKPWQIRVHSEITVGGDYSRSNVVLCDVSDDVYCTQFCDEDGASHQSESSRRRAIIDVVSRQVNDGCFRWRRRWRRRRDAISWVVSTFHLVSPRLHSAARLGRQTSHSWRIPWTLSSRETR